VVIHTASPQIRILKMVEVYTLLDTLSGQEDGYFRNLIDIHQEVYKNAGFSDTAYAVV